MPTILVIDDYEPLLQMLAMKLEATGYQVIALSKPSDALLVATTGHDIDLVITDYTMPEMSGGELIAEIRRRRPEMPILILSGADHTPCGENVFVSKAAATWRRDLLEAITGLLGGDRCTSKDASNNRETVKQKKAKPLKHYDISKAS